MSNLPISSKYRSQPSEPVTDSERDDLTSRLNGAYEAGSIDVDDYQALLDQVYRARTLGELAPVVERVPVRPTYDVPAIVQQGSLPPGQVNTPRAGAMEPVRARRLLTYVMGAGVTLIMILVSLWVLHLVM